MTVTVQGLFLLPVLLAGCTTAPVTDQARIDRMTQKMQADCAKQGAQFVPGGVRVTHDQSGDQNGAHASENSIHTVDTDSPAGNSKDHYEVKGDCLGTPPELTFTTKWVYPDRTAKPAGPP